MSESSNRAFMYGESVFTTMRMVNGQLMNWDYHFERLKKGVEFVYGPFSEGPEWEQVLNRRCEKMFQEKSGDKILRLTVYLEGGRGLKSLKHVNANSLALDLSTSALVSAPQKKLRFRTCEMAPRPEWWPDFLKAGNYLETILAQKRFLSEEEDDLIFLSRGRSVLESSVANIFIVKNNKLFTPPTGPQVLSGVMRKKVLESATSYFDESAEIEITSKQLFQADAVFGTNSLRGPFLIDCIDGFDYTHTQEFLVKFDQMKKRVLT